MKEFTIKTPTYFLELKYIETENLKDVLEKVIEGIKRTDFYKKG